MDFRKHELKKFLIWMRNGTCFAVTWLLILLLIGCYGFGTNYLSVSALAKIVLLSAGGVFLFSACFTKLFFVRWSFLTRISVFMVSLGIYQILAFYLIGLIGDGGTFAQWGIYGGILLVSYLGCLLIYFACYSKKSKIYTQALHEYQKKRGANYGK